MYIFTFFPAFFLQNKQETEYPYYISLNKKPDLPVYVYVYLIPYEIMREIRVWNFLMKYMVNCNSTASQDCKKLVLLTRSAWLVT